MNSNDRFVWIDSAELCDKHLGVVETINGKEMSHFSDKDEGFIYDTVEKVRVLDFGNDEQYYPTCGTKPNDKYLAVIMDALNNIKGEL